jgi:outer membrane receptor protein involved in Fe transport
MLRIALFSLILPFVEPQTDDDVVSVSVVQTVETERPLTAASARTVREQDLKLRPIESPADLLRVTPGLMVVQHAGGGKANQYLLRGFDADHGTDIELTFDGLPLNMVSHGHGQGYSDANFIIPELIGQVEVSKGPYFAESGDFATAGSIGLVTKEAPESMVSVGGGSFNTLRTVGIVAPDVSRAVHPLAAVEWSHTDGPFQNKEDFRKLNLYGRVSYDFATRQRLWLGASSYGGRWNASGQIPTRAVRAGLVDFYGSLDPTEGGSSSRQNAYLGYRWRPGDTSELTALGYVIRYDFKLRSNFTFFSRNATDGDDIQQSDNRVIAGGRARYRWLREWRGLLFDSSVGGSVRHDAIDNGLVSAPASPLDDNVSETALGAFAKEEVQIWRWLRLVGALRADHFAFEVHDRAMNTTASKSASRLSPKASLILSPHPTTDLFLNFGYGFHSNDARGVVMAVDPVTPLTRALGYEAGARTRVVGDRLELAAALWGLDIDSEIVWVGDEGTTEASNATRRLGVEFEARAQLLPWLFADTDITAGSARFRQNAGNGNAVALAPRFTFSGGLSVLHPSGWRGALRGLYIAERPATEDGFLQAEATSLIDAFVAYRWRSTEVAINVENLINRRYKSAQFATVTRLPNEAPTTAPPPPNACPPGTRAATAKGTGNFTGCEDISFSPGNPFNLRLTASYYF